MLGRILYTVGMFFLYQGVLPLAFGSVILKFGKEKEQTFFWRYTIGYLMQFSVFYVISRMAIKKEMTLTYTTKLWMVLGGISILLAILYTGREIWYSLFKIFRKSTYVNMNIGMIVLGVIILTRLFTSASFQDNTIEMTLTSWATDTLFVYEPYTGAQYVELPIEAESPVCVFYAVLAKILKIHPTVLIKWILPFLLIGSCMESYKKIGEFLFHGDSKKCCCWMVIVMGIYASFVFSESLIGFQLFTTPWNGIVLFVNFVIPVSFYVVLKWLDDMKWKKSVFYIINLIGLGMVGQLFYVRGAVFTITIILVAIVVNIVRRCCKND